MHKRHSTIVVAFLVLALCCGLYFFAQQEDKISCEGQEPASEYLASLTPSVSLDLCLFWNEQRDEHLGIVAKGCKAPLYTRYIAQDGEETILLKNKTDFINYFAPVETEEEALAFATALTEAYPMYYIVVPQHYRTFTSYVEPTKVTRTNDGFIVNLFAYDRCGCGPHSYYKVNYKVTPEGTVTEISRKRLYENPEEDELCID